MHVYKEVVAEREKLQKGEDIAEKISNLPKSTSNKIKKYTQTLMDNGYDVEKNGETISEQTLKEALYCITGKGKIADDPLLKDLEDKLRLFAKIRFPKGVISAKVGREMKKLKRLNKAK